MAGGTRGWWAETAANVVPGLALSDRPLLIIGEVGSGRATLARAVHAASARSGPWLPVHAADTGADVLLTCHVAAAGGTLCIRQVEGLPAPAQTALLRLLAARATVRLIATASPAAPERVAAGRLRGDLWQALQALRLDVPPLRERMNEVPAIVEAMLTDRSDGAPLLLSPEAKAALLSYHWPLNLQELWDSLTLAVANAGGARLVGLEHLPPEVSRSYREAGGAGVYGRFQKAVERTLLQWCGANVSRRSEMAPLLGLSRAGLYKQLKKHGLLDDRHRKMPG